MTVLILTHEGDLTADRVAVELAVRGVPVVRLDQASIPQHTSITALISTSEAWSGRLADESGELVDLSAVRAVWHRHTRQFVVDDRMSGPERAFAYGEARRGFGGVLAALGLQQALWVNDPVAAARAEYKPVQLQAAVQVGLSIPRTIITSDPVSAHDWALELGQPIVYKPLSGAWHADEGQIRLIYTTPVTDPGELLDPAIGQTAHMFQEQIAKQCEARALIVGSQVFAVQINAHSQAARQDWRSDYDNLSYEPLTLPHEVELGLLNLHSRLGLVYGAVDLICDQSGRWIFLETNQSGEWGWLAAETDVPVAPALADLLTGGT
jgi:ATP-grasp ribosomal peptide maturase